ncbi:MAG: hypothetical protein V1729_07260 [Candidatus Woesearchaeota archaeon]
MGCSVPVWKLESKQTRKVLNIYVDGGSGDDVGAILISKIRIDSGKINLTILAEDPQNDVLKDALNDIESKGNLSLTAENMEGGNLVMFAKPVAPDDPNYIYAVSESLRIDYGIRSVVGKETI